MLSIEIRETRLVDLSADLRPSLLFLPGREPVSLSGHAHGKLFAARAKRGQTSGCLRRAGNGRGFGRLRDPSAFFDSLKLGSGALRELDGRGGLSDEALELARLPGLLAQPLLGTPLRDTFALLGWTPIDTCLVDSLLCSAHLRGCRFRGLSEIPELVARRRELRLQIRGAPPKRIPLGSLLEHSMLRREHDDSFVADEIARDRHRSPARLERWSKAER
jgi:hypothetical protein